MSLEKLAWRMIFRCRAGRLVGPVRRLHLLAPRSAVRFVSRRSIAIQKGRPAPRVNGGLYA